MSSRQILKKRARKVLKKQYLIFVLICLIAAFIGSEFNTTLSATKIKIPLPDNSLIIESTLQGEFEEGKKIVSKNKEELKNNKELHKSEILGRKRGVFASVINSISTGSLILAITTTINSLVGSKSITIGILIVFSFLFIFLVWFYLVNAYKVIARRLSLEGRKYKKVPIPRFIYLLRIRKWTKVSMTMLITSIFQGLWSLTIVGGIIKRYSYYLVPYIVAENPNIPSLEAIKLSRRMMNGYKVRLFLLEFSYLGWEILGIFTFGLTKILYSNPYKLAVCGEYYEEIRRIRKEEKLEGTRYLNDKYLFEKADEELLEKEYSDVLETLKSRKETTMSKQTFKAKTMSLLGITLYNSKEENEFEKEQVRLAKIEALKDALKGKSYPTRLFPIREKRKRNHIETINYLRRYSIFSLIILFFIFSTVGWLWEVILHLITDGEFVKRGVLQGPWLPIYGSGAILILTVLYKLRRKPLFEFISIIILCGIVEYFTSYYLEILQGKRWWDYSGYFLNLHGRICAEGLLVFGLGGILIVYLVAPLLDNHIRKINNRILIPLCIILVCLFAVDEVYSIKYPNTGRGITEYITVKKE